MITVKKVAFTTLGCKLNFSESSAIAHEFEENGYEKVSDDEAADVFVINTCTVTELANKKSKQAIRKIINRNPKAIIVAVGCYSQLKPEEVASIEGVNLILGSENKFQILNELRKLDGSTDKKIVIDDKNQQKNFTPTYSYGDRTRSFLKIQDGCDYYCSYCAIPNARGRSRSNTIEATLAKAAEVVSKGVKEIILTGVNIGDFGKSNGESFLNLIQQLEKLPDLERLRISSIEPNLLNDDILNMVSKSQIVLPHFHIPLQCGTDNLLRKMRRRYTTSLYRKRIEFIKHLMPHACIAADIIVGVPGETEEDFEASIQFIESIDISYLHVFTYSERENTLAVKMEDQVPLVIRKDRSKRMHNLALRKQILFQSQYLGTTRPVLFESAETKNISGGFTDNYIRVELEYDPNLSNTTKQVKLAEIKPNGNVAGILIQ
jgi:threonylcarbamoyladenosine tRNA methylthiotransferase MtaB